MIEKINLESDTDLASVLGRTALVTGSAYGLYKTRGELNKVTSPGRMRMNMSKYANMGRMNEAVNKIDIPQKSFADLDKGLLDMFKSIGQKTERETMLTSKEAMDYLSKHTGYKGRSSGLITEVEKLTQELQSRFGTGIMPEFHLTKGRFGAPDFMRMQLNHLSFQIPLVSSAGGIKLRSGDSNIYTARSMLKDYNLREGSVAIEGLDVALVRNYIENLNDIISGKRTAYDIKRTFTDRAIWETSRGKIDKSKTAAGAIQKLRLEEVVADPTGRLTSSAVQAIMKDVTSIKGYSGGSASTMQKGVFTSPESLVSRGLPGAESSISAYQAIRQSQFFGKTKKGIKWSSEADLGGARFKVATINDLETLKEAALRAGHYSFGELAEEEGLLSSKVRAKIKNEMYQFHLDINKPQTEFASKLLDKVKTNLAMQGVTPEEISQMMISGKSNTSIQSKLEKALAGVDLNADYENLKKIEQNAVNDLSSLNAERKRLKNLDVPGDKSSKMKKINQRISGRIDQLKRVRKEMAGYGVLGYDEFGNQIKLPTNDTRNIVKDISITGDKLNIATESHYKFGRGSKVFSGGGGAKVTIKDVVNVPLIMGWAEELKMSALEGRAPSEAGARAFAKVFNDVDIILRESPIKIKEGVLAPREVTSAIMSYGENILETGSAKDIERLSEIGIVNNEFIGTQLTGKELIQKIKDWHPNKTMSEIFGGEEFIGSKVSNMFLTPDVSSGQSGVGKMGTLSDRAAYNLQALGLDEVLSDFYSKRASSFNPFAQLQQMETVDSLLKDSKYAGESYKGFVADSGLDRLFQSNIADRRKMFGDKDFKIINLGEETKKLTGIEKVPVFASETMKQYVAGEEGFSQLDNATRGLVEAVAAGNKEEVVIRKANEYKKAMEQIKEGIGENLFKAKIETSMYGQAVSSLSGMDEAAKILGQEMGLKGGVEAPLIAMSKADIRKRFGSKGLQMAMENNLWGVMTREPIEGVHSSIPVNIRIAEDFGYSGKETGRVFVSGENLLQSLIRKPSFLDFDKDTVNVIAATTDKAMEQIRSFYGLNGGRNATGHEFLNSLERMAAFQLKGREPMDILSLSEDEIIRLNTSQKWQEKGLIGSFSDEFKNIHIGLRETIGKGGAGKNFYLAEDFSHLFVENILKAKHQSKEALLAGSVEEALDLLRSEVGTKYSQMGKGEKAQELQRIFDNLSYGNQELANEVRQSTAAMVDESLAGKMGFAKELAQAKKIENAEKAAAAVETVLMQATKQRDAFAQIASVRNIENVIEAHSIGREVLKAGDYSTSIALRGMSRNAGMLERAKDIVGGASEFMSKGLKNVGLWGILPAAGIGLLASLTTKPKVLQPVLTAGKDHEGQAPAQTSSVSMGKTLFSIPESRLSGYSISGKVDGTNNLNNIINMIGSSGQKSSISVKDHRAHMNKYTIEEMIEKGY